MDAAELEQVQLGIIGDLLVELCGFLTITGRLSVLLARVEQPSLR